MSRITRTSSASRPLSATSTSEGKVVVAGSCDAPGAGGRSILNDYQTPAQLAGELGICAKTLDRWQRLGEGPPRCKVGRRVLYRRSSVVAWLASREEKTAA